MIKLIRLEWKKNDIGRYIRSALLLAVLLTAFILHWNSWGSQMTRTARWMQRRGRT